MEQTGKCWLFVPLVSEKLSSGGTLQANHLRTRHGLFPLMRLRPFAALLPGVWDGGRRAQPGVPPTKATKARQHLPPPQPSRWSRGPFRPRNSEQSCCTSSVAPLGRNERRKQGVVLSYVTSFLGVRGPGCHSPELGGAAGGGEGGFHHCLCCLSSRPQQALRSPSTPAPRRHLPLGVVV